MSKIFDWLGILIGIGFIIGGAIGWHATFPQLTMVVGLWMLDMSSRNLQSEK